MILKHLILAASISLLLFCSACTIVTDTRKIASAEDYLRQKQYPKAVAVYQEVLEERPHSFYAADVRYDLVMALIATDNTQKDYALALHECEEFVKSSPNDRRTPEIRNMIGLLRMITNLNRNIEDLKKLDIRHEERRRK